jgi:hypothetical protein
MRGAMDANISDRVDPRSHLSIQIVESLNPVDPGPEVPPNIPHRPFHLPFFT